MTTRATWLVLAFVSACGSKAAPPAAPKPAQPQEAAKPEPAKPEAAKPAPGPERVTKSGAQACATAGGACMESARLVQESLDACKVEPRALCGGSYTCCVLAYDVPIAPMSAASK